jgi:hypothetical protein
MLAIEKMGAIDPDSPFFWLNSPATPDPDWLIATEMAKSFDGVVYETIIYLTLKKMENSISN